MAEKRGAPLAQAPNSPTRYQRGIFPEDARVSGVGRAIDLPVQALNPYPLNVETGERELAVPGLFEGIAALGRGTAEAIRNPVSTAQQAVEGIGGFLQEQMRASSIRPGQMVTDEEGMMRQATSDELSAALDPTLGGTFAAPLVTRGALGGLEGLMPEAGTLMSLGKPVQGRRTIGFSETNRFSPETEVYRFQTKADVGEGTTYDVLELNVPFVSRPANHVAANVKTGPVSLKDYQALIRESDLLPEERREALRFAEMSVDTNGNIRPDFLQQTLDQENIVKDLQASVLEPGAIENVREDLQRQPLIDDGRDFDGAPNVREPTADEVSELDLYDIGVINLYPDVDNPTGNNDFGVIRLTLPKKALENKTGNAYSGTVKAEHDKFFTGGKTGLTEAEARETSAMNRETAPFAFARFDDVPSHFDPETGKTKPVERKKNSMGELVGLKGDMALFELQSDVYGAVRKKEGTAPFFKMYEDMEVNDVPVKAAIVKTAVKSAIERDNAGVLLPSGSINKANSSLYTTEKMKALAERVTSDLGPEFSYEIVQLPMHRSNWPEKFEKKYSAAEEHNIEVFNNPSAGKPRQLPEPPKSKHVRITWDPDANLEAIPFKDGGIVDLGPRPASRGIEDVIRKYRREGMMD
jgi:hypothetical protein